MDGFEAIGREAGVTALYLHGSRLTGTARADSDLDLAVLVPHGWADVKTERVLAEVAERVAAMKSLPVELVDVQDLRAAPARFRSRVVLQGRLVYVGDSTELARFQAASMAEAWDGEYFLQPIREAMRTRIKEGRFASRQGIRRGRIGGRRECRSVRLGFLEMELHEGQSGERPVPSPMFLPLADVQTAVE